MLLLMPRLRKPRPVPVEIIEDADEILTEDNVDDRSHFNLGDGTRWVPASPTEDSD